MSRGRASAAEERTPLSRHRALAAALELVDGEGLEALTMRRLARELGVAPMALYHHVANRGAILDGMVALVFSEVHLSPEGTGWTHAMRHHAHSLRDALRRHPWAVPVMSRISGEEASLRHHDALIGRCRRSGFSIAMAAHTFSLVDSYVYGFVLNEGGAAGLSAELEFEYGLGLIVDRLHAAAQESERASRA